MKGSSRDYNTMYHNGPAVSGGSAMDSLSLILAALGTGATYSAKSMNGEAIKDAYNGLKTRLQHRFASKTSAEIALIEHEKDPATWEAPLKKALVQAHVDQDKDIIQAAQEVMMRVYPEQRAKAG